MFLRRYSNGLLCGRSNLFILLESATSFTSWVKQMSSNRAPFAVVVDKNIAFFEELLGSSRVVTNPDDLISHNRDWLGTVKGSSKLLLKPKTTEEVSEILAYCNKNYLAVCPQGGNTGLVGGSVPVFDEIILSTSLMNKIESVDELTGAMVCQSGCVLEALDQHLSELGFMMPIDLGAKGSCQIGGNVSTNAGGLRYLRYGSLHGSVLGVEAVLASGEVVNCLSTLKKDNTGYDLKHLFIGSEGTLGVVTKVSIHCATKPVSKNLAILGLNSFDGVLKTFKVAKESLSEILNSCEFMDNQSMSAVTDNLKLACPIGNHPFYMWIEAAGSNECHDKEKMEIFLKKVLSEESVIDGTLVSESFKVTAIWALRERIAEALLKDGHLYTWDISLPLSLMYKLVEDYRDKLGKRTIRCCGFGHLGDGNLHLAITTKTYEEEIQKFMEPSLYEEVSKCRGSISAEHGLGIFKKNYSKYTKSHTALSIMKDLKALMDPKGILNPYKVLSDEFIHPLELKKISD